MFRSPTCRRSISYESSSSGPPHPSRVAASFHERSNASPTRVHTKSTGGNEQVYGIAGQKHAPSAVTIGQEKVLTPFAAVDHLVADGCPNGLLEALPHFLI